MSVRLIPWFYSDRGRRRPQQADANLTAKFSLLSATSGDGPILASEGALDTAHAEDKPRWQALFCNEKI